MLAGLLASKYSQKRVDSRGHFIMDYSSIALWIAIENLLTYGSLFKYWFGNALGVVWELFRGCSSVDGRLFRENLEIFY